MDSGDTGYTVSPKSNASKALIQNHKCTKCTRPDTSGRAEKTRSLHAARQLRGSTGRKSRAEYGRIAGL
jgi:hypothetical protein